MTRDDRAGSEADFLNGKSRCIGSSSNLPYSPQRRSCALHNVMHVAKEQVPVALANHQVRKRRRMKWSTVLRISASFIRLFSLSVRTVCGLCRTPHTAQMLTSAHSVIQSFFLPFQCFRLSSILRQYVQKLTDTRIDRYL